MQIRLSPEFPQQIRRVWQLSIPAILTQISSIMMQYIDSAMVGSLGANASAAIGLVSTSTWLLGGLCSAVSAGFSVQIAHQIGAGEHKKARDVLKHGILTALILSGILMLGGIAISWQLPVWLGGEEILHRDASLYFLVYAATLPFTQLNWLASACLQCSGNMVTPSILNTVVCVLDAVFNALFIPRYGVLGAALGTGLAMGVVSLVMMWACFLRSPELNLRRKEHCNLDKGILKRALRIGSPVGAEQIAMSGAMVVTTMIVAPLGTIAIAANSCGYYAGWAEHWRGRACARKKIWQPCDRTWLRHHDADGGFNVFYLPVGIPDAYTRPFGSGIGRGGAAHWPYCGAALCSFHCGKRGAARRRGYPGSEPIKPCKHLDCADRACSFAGGAVRPAWDLGRHGNGIVRKRVAASASAVPLKILYRRKVEAYLCLGISC